MADPEIWQALLETGNPYVQQERRNKGLAEMLAIEKAQRGLRQEEQLQQLFARSQKPSVSEVGAVMLSYVPDYVKSQYEWQRQQQELDQTNYEQNASIFGPISERALIAKQSGDPQWQEKFNRDMGIAASGIVQSGGRLPNNFNPQQADPWTVLTNSVGFKYKSPYMENMMAVQRTQAEQAARFPYDVRLKQTAGPSDLTYIGPDGLPHPMPSQYLQTGAGGQPPVQSTISPYPVFEFDGKTYQGPEFMRMTIREKDPVKKQRMEAIMDAGFKQQQEGTLTDPNAVKMPPTRQELAIEEETGKERAKLKVQDEQDAENKLSTIASMPSDEDLMKYLNDATLGKGEEILKGPVASFFHIQNEAQAADTVLGALQENIKNIATKAKGDMNIAEVRNYESAVGALNNKELGPQARFQAYLAAKNMAIKKIALKHPEIAAKYGMGTAAQAGNQQPQIPEPKTVEEARKLPKGTVFKVPGTGQLKIVD